MLKLSKFSAGKLVKSYLEVWTFQKSLGAKLPLLPCRLRKNEQQKIFGLLVIKQAINGCSRSILSFLCTWRFF